MGEDLADVLLKAADAMHWLGHYTTCNALILMSRLLRVHKLDDLDKLAAFVEREEAAMPNEGGEHGQQ